MRAKASLDAGAGGPGRAPFLMRAKVEHDRLTLTHENTHAMTPIASQIKARTLKEFGELVRHRGIEQTYAWSFSQQHAAATRQ